MVTRLKRELNDSKNFTKVIKTPKKRRVPMPHGNYMTTCLICSTTCHKYCCISDDSDKSGCACIENNYCIKFKNKCHWTQHKKRPNYYEDYIDEEIVTLDELKKKYCDSKSDLDKKTQLLLGAKQDLINLNIECINTHDLINKSINRLQQIALNKAVFESSEEYIELLIEKEKSELKEEWQTRIKGLKLLKQHKRMLREIYKGEDQMMNDMRKFSEDSLNKE